MRWLLWTMYAVFAVLALGVAIVWWRYEEEARGPALAEGMWWTRDCCNVDSPYDERLRQTFLGRPEAFLRQELEHQDFDFMADRKATARWSDLACAYFANVGWETDSYDRVTAVKGDVGSACL